MKDFRIAEMTALQLGAEIKKRTVSVREAVMAYLDEIGRKDGAINACITVDEEGALKRAESVQQSIDRGELISPLAGVPYLAKDNICTQGIRTTAASKMLADFVPPYDATVISRLSENGAVLLGKTNLDEFAMGGSTETSYFGPTRNPWDVGRVPGGSSGGSAAAVAAGMAPYALGSDTGGSIRQPCAFCGLTGVKPTYGSVSRFGLLAYASSLDQIGPIGQDAKDCAAVLALIAGRDPRDSTSVMDAPFDFHRARGKAASEIRIGLPTNFFELGLDREVRSSVLAAAVELENAGAVIEGFEMPEIQHAVAAYYILACAEASSNLSRYDGVKYGYRSQSAEDLTTSYYRTRSEGFGTEVKRRILLGTFVLSSGFFDAYYKKALQVRGLIKKALDQAFEKYDAILSPVSPGPAYVIGGQIADPMAMYLADIYTVSVNLAGMPAVALPCGSTERGLPIGFQLIGRAFSEPALLEIAQKYQEQTDFHRNRPRAPGFAKSEGKEAKRDEI